MFRLVLIGKFLDVFPDGLLLIHLPLTGWGLCENAIFAQTTRLRLRCFEFLRQLGNFDRASHIDRYLFTVVSKDLRHIVIL